MYEIYFTHNGNDYTWNAYTEEEAEAIAQFILLEFGEVAFISD